MAMTTDEKSTAILRKIVEICNEQMGEDPMGAVVTIGPDWGGNALTIAIGDSHTHVGSTDATFEKLIDSLYALLLENRGLSWARRVREDEAKAESEAE